MRWYFFIIFFLPPYFMHISFFELQLDFCTEAKNFFLHIPFWLMRICELQACIYWELEEVILNYCILRRYSNLLTYTIIFMAQNMYSKAFEDADEVATLEARRLRLYYGLTVLGILLVIILYDQKAAFNYNWSKYCPNK